MAREGVQGLGAQLGVVEPAEQARVIGDHHLVELEGDGIVRRHRRHPRQKAR
jgi:hypothetical protein